MSALDDKDVPSAEQWQSAVKFMTSAVKKEIKSAEENLDKLVGPKSFYDRWLRWRSQSEIEGKRQAIAEELTKFLNAEPVSLRTCAYTCMCMCFGDWRPLPTHCPVQPFGKGSLACTCATPPLLLP